MEFIFKKIMNKNFLIILHLLFLLASCSQFGEIPSGDHLEKIKKSPNYDIEKESFNNRIENSFLFGVRQLLAQAIIYGRVARIFMPLLVYTYSIDTNAVGHIFDSPSP